MTGHVVLSYEIYIYLASMLKNRLKDLAVNKYVLNEEEGKEINLEVGDTCVVTFQGSFGSEQNVT